MCTTHPLTWPTSYPRATALEGFRDFLSSEPLTHAIADHPIVKALRPGLSNRTLSSESYEDVDDDKDDDSSEQSTHNTEADDDDKVHDDDDERPSTNAPAAGSSTDPAVEEDFVTTLRTHLENIAVSVSDDGTLRLSLHECVENFRTLLLQLRKENLLRLLDEKPKS